MKRKSLINQMLRELREREKGIMPPANNSGPLARRYTKNTAINEAYIQANVRHDLNQLQRTKKYMSDAHLKHQMIWANTKQGMNYYKWKLKRI